MEPFWDLKFSGICRVSCACIQRIPYKQRVAFSDEQRRPNLNLVMYRLTHWYLITGFPPTCQGASSLTTFVWNSTPLRSDTCSLCSIETVCVAIVNKFIVSRILLSRRRRLDAVLPSLELQVFKKLRLDMKSIRWWRQAMLCLYFIHPQLLGLSKPYILQIKLKGDSAAQYRSSSAWARVPNIEAFRYRVYQSPQILKAGPAGDQEIFSYLTVAS